MPSTASASSTSNQFGDATPFKIQVNFDIPLFEGNIDADALDNWLNVLEGYFSIHNFFDRENIILHSLRKSPMSKIGGVLIGNKTHQTSLKCLGQIPLGPIS